MINKKRTLVCGIVSALALFGTGVLASEVAPYNGVNDCIASIKLEKTSGTFQIFEGGHPIHPITPKEIDGYYLAENAYGHQARQTVYKSLQSGQLVEVKYAPSGYTSIEGRMGYYLNGVYKGFITERY